MRIFKALFMFALFPTCLLMSEAANAKPAKCVIEYGGDEYTFPCEFTPTGGGSFEIDVTNHIEGIDFIRLDVVSKGKGNVSAYYFRHTSFGMKMFENEDWRAFNLIRSGACWSGDWLKICVY